MEDETRPRKPYPSDVSDEECAFVLPYLSLITSDAPQSTHDLSEVFNALRWFDAGVFTTMTHDLRELLRWSAGRDPDPSKVIFDSTTRQSTPESESRAAMTATNAARAARCTSPWILWGICWRCTSPRPTRSTGSRWLSWPKRCRRRCRRWRQPSTASRWSLSSSTKPNAALSCCQDAGSSSAVLPGPRASGGWPRATNDCLRQSKASNSSPSSASCSHDCSCSPIKVPDRI